MAWSNGKREWNKRKLLLSKVLGANERYVFYIYLKTIETFWPSQYLGTEQFVWLYCDICFIVLVCQYQPIYIKSLVDNFILSALQDVFSLFYTLISNKSFTNCIFSPLNFFFTAFATIFVFNTFARCVQVWCLYVYPIWRLVMNILKIEIHLINQVGKFGVIISSNIFSPLFSPFRPPIV